MRPVLISAALIVAARLCSQSAPPAAIALPDAASRQTAGDERDWLLPIRADADEAGAYWASGPTYKVRFAEGMTFHPVLGAEAPRNLPLGWRTESIACGNGSSVPLAAATARASAWRYELARPGVTEIYDVRETGVEQSFVVAAPSGAIDGDLVIRGRIETSLHCAPRPATHAPLRFADATGRDVLEYGAAIAFDAAGRRTAVTTALADGVVELRLDGTWLRDATWPVTVDPLTRRVAIIASALGAASHPTLAHDDDTHRFALTDVRPVSASDYDLLLRVRNSDWSNAATIFSELTTADTRHAAISLVTAFNAPSRWVLAFQRQTATTSRIRVYFNDARDLGGATGLLVEIPTPAGIHDAEPSLGPVAYLDTLLVARRDAAPLPSNTEASYPVGFLIDAQARTVGPATSLHINPGNNFDVEHVKVTGDGGIASLVAWQEYNFDNPGDDWDVIVTDVTGGTPYAYLVLGESGNSGLHKISPFIAGDGTSWAVAYLTLPNTGVKNVGLLGSVLRVQRFHYSALSGGQLQPSRVVDAAATPDLLLGRANRPFALAGTDSHWGVAWRREQANELRIARIGWDGGIAEEALLEPTPTSGSMAAPSMCVDETDGILTVVYPSSGVATGDPIYTRRFLMDDRASLSSYGTGCAGTAGFYTLSSYAETPYAGSFSLLSLTGGRVNAPTVLFAGLGATDLPLPSAGAGCRLLLDPTLPIVAVAQKVATASGATYVYFDIPSHLRGVDLRWQFVQYDVGLLWSSNGLRTVVY